ncbi:MAG TPA: Rieske 2Fe-2S domain-containing protein [Acidimicrobiales bacterium]|nr:Rieske 2Fe-2S domain-containing protein [Acidimicrobiales bacterium]
MSDPTDVDDHSERAGTEAPGEQAGEQPRAQPVAMPRRRFLTNTWRAGGLAIAAAGAWTAWDLLQPGETTGFGGVVETVPPDAVPEDDVLPAPTARAYLTVVDGEVTALYWKCTHLGCRVPWCASSGRFECPCHGSVFSRAGDYISGPAPRGMDQFATTVQGGVVVIDTADVIEGRPHGDTLLDQPARGPSCMGGGE